MTLFAQSLLRGWSLGDLLVTAVLCAAAVALAWVAMKRFGVYPPAWLVEVFWIVVAAVVVVAAIRFVLSL